MISEKTRGDGRKMRADRRLAIVVSMLAAIAIALAGCGGGGGTSSSPAPAPSPPTLTLTTASPSGAAVEGGAPITLSLTGVTSVNGNIAWAMNPTIGILSSTSSTGAVYTPPALGQLTGATNVTVTATPSEGSAAVVMFTIVLKPFGSAATTPASGVATSTDVQPTVQFSRTVEPSSLGASAVSLASPIATVPASVSASSAVVTLTPQSALVWGGHYTVSVADSVSSLLGQTLGTPESFEFDVAAPTWTTATALNAQIGETPGLAFDHAGHAFAIWQTIDGTTLNVARFDLASRTWFAPVMLQASVQVVAPPILAVDAAGDVMAVWASTVSGSVTPNVFASRLDAKTQQWGVPVLIQTVADRSVEGPPQVATDPAGDTIAIWPQSTNSLTEYRMYAAHFDASTGQWAPAVGMSLADDATLPHVALDAVGNGTAVWSEGTTTGAATLQAARWSVATSSWAASTPIPGASGFSSIASTGSVVVWAEYLPLSTPWSPQTSYIEFSRFDSNSGTWSAAQRLSVGTADQSSAPQIQADSSGDVIVVWRQTTGLGDVVNSARFDARAGTWSAPLTLDTVADTSAYAWRYPPSVFVDPAGNATAIWDRRVVGADQSSYFPFYARFDSHLGTWTAGAPLPGARALLDVVSATVDDQGNLLTGWSEPGGYALSWALLGGS
jgi:hypothetical protein